MFNALLLEFVTVHGLGLVSESSFSVNQVSERHGSGVRGVRLRVRRIRRVSRRRGCSGRHEM